MAPVETVCVVGLGYIGLPTSVILAKAGYQVVGVDVSERAVAAINSGKAHIVEPDLDGLLRHVVDAGLLQAQTHPEPAEVFVIAVPTPFRGDHEPDLSFVESAARSIAPHVEPGALVILESTVPPGATEQMVEWILEERPDLSAPGTGEGAFYAAHCPERVLPGRILVELVDNDRVVGGVDAESTAVASRFYRGFVRGECVGTTARTAELAKLAENAFRDSNIAFANELSIVAQELGVDAHELVALANRHPRVNILNPGPGVGGHCIAVDPWFIVDAAPEQTPFIRAARETNLRKTDWVVGQILERAERHGASSIALLGLAYKANVDDLRESPSVEVAEAVIASDFAGDVWLVEPHIDELPARLNGSQDRLVSLDTISQPGTLFVGLVGHRAFEGLPAQLEDPLLVYDVCGMWR